MGDNDLGHITPDGRIIWAEPIRKAMLNPRAANRTLRDVLDPPLKLVPPLSTSADGAPTTPSTPDTGCRTGR